MGIIGGRQQRAGEAMAAILAGTLVLAGCSTESTSASAAASDFTGAGATFPAPIYAKWGSAYKKVAGSALNYQAIGSGAGIAQIKARTVDFGATDDPMKPADLQADGLVQFPAVIGGLVVIVNVPGLQNGQLKLTAPVVADLFEGRITRWNDPKLVALNPGVELRPIPVTPVYRSDSSGTTAVFTKYLAKAAPNWTLGAGKTVSWPVGTGGKGNDGVAGNVKNGVGTIGYVEYNYASANRLNMARMRNASGKFVLPSAASFTAASTQVVWAAAPGAVADMLDLGGVDTWPIVSATYILMPIRPARIEQTKQAIAFFRWSYENGDGAAQELGYLPLPEAAELRAIGEMLRVGKPV
jgi:phosphate transport system substrate-binding protein